MKVSYNGFTGELMKLERSVNLTTKKPCYKLDIWDKENKVSYSFIDVDVQDVKFLGGVVAFGE